MVGVELFSGAGGMSVGAAMAGVKVKLAVEIDKYAAETFQHNHPEALVLNKDIREIRELKIDVPKGEQKILFGGPPCQGFSRSNHQTRNRNNPNNWLFEEFLRIADLWKPDWLVLENVQGILGTEQGMFLNQIVEGFRRLGYTPTFKVLNAKDFGVPQNRERLFIVGSLHGVEFVFPNSTSYTTATVKEALSDLPTLINGSSEGELPYKELPNFDYAKKLRGEQMICKNNLVSKNTPVVINRYKYIPQGGNWQNIPSELMFSYKDSSRCHTGIYRRLHEDQPSVVIGNYRKNMLIHPTEDRGLSVREAARLQSFPDCFEFKGNLGNQQQQVGNAVPPYLSKSVFACINDKFR